MNQKETYRIELEQRFKENHSNVERNYNGQFFTPYALAKAITEYTLKHTGDKVHVLEPACGFGSFISAIQDTCPNAVITGIEKDNEIFSDISSILNTENIELVCEDFLRFQPPTQKYDAIITNPPYTRHHHISQDLKLEYKETVKKTIGCELSGLSGLHAYFILYGMSMLKDNGIASWLIPAETFSVKYGRQITEYLMANTQILRIHFFQEDNCQFKDALVSSCVLTIKNKKPNGNEVVLITRGDYNSPENSINIAASNLSEISKWQHIFIKPTDATDKTVSDYFTVKRGISTGSESFFTKKRSDWNSMGIEDQWLMPVLPSPRCVKSDIITSDTDGWPKEYDLAVLSLPTEMNEAELPESIQEYLSTCPEKVRNCYTLQHRKKWFAIEKRKPAPIVCTYMGRNQNKPFRFILNRSNAVVMTTYLCLYPIVSLSEKQLQDACKKLNAIPVEQLVAGGRTYGGGLCKLEPSELLAIPFSI